MLQSDQLYKPAPKDLQRTQTQSESNDLHKIKAHPEPNGPHKIQAKPEPNGPPTRT